MTLQEGYDASEAATLIAMITAMDGAAPAPLVLPAFPEHWTIVFDSPIIGVFDNKWQLARNTAAPGQYALLLRGTVAQKGSIIDDVLSVMIPAQGSCFGMSYQFAHNPHAAIHLGFTLATLILLFDPTHGILTTLATHADSLRELYIAGHSQGAALTALCHAYMHATDIPALRQVHIKSYGYAQPKPGNDHFRADFDQALGTPGWSLSVLNSQDWVPQLPLTVQLLSDITPPNLLSVSLTEHLLLAPLTAAFKAVTGGLTIGQLSKHHPHIALLAKMIGHQPGGTPQSTDTPLDFPHPVLSLNFVGCGNPVVITGPAGGNPVDPTDGLWQHHSVLYAALVSGSPLPGVGTASTTTPLTATPTSLPT